MSSSEQVVREAAAIASVIDSKIGDQEAAILPQDLRALADADGPPRAARIGLALWGDALHAATLTLDSDREASAAEFDWIHPLARQLGRFLAQLRPTYHAFRDLPRDEVGSFLSTYRNDPLPFGRACQATHWRGLDLCRQFAAVTGDADPLDRYEKLILTVIDEMYAAGEVSEEARTQQESMRELIALRRRIEERDDTLVQGEDARAEVFYRSLGPRVFTSVAYAHQVWERDPFDVRAIHSGARDSFERLVDAASAGGQLTGHMLLIRGSAGSGKTHLVRAFRNYVHRKRLGMAGYLQMTSGSGDYGRYVLNNLVDSLQRPFDRPVVESSGLMVLSDALAQLPNGLTAEQRETLISGTDDDVVSELVDHLLGHPKLEGFDPDLLRVVLQLQRRDPMITARAIKYLRCHDLNDWDRRKLGGIAPRTADGDALRTVIELGQLVAAAMGGSLVLLVDQLEDIFHMEEIKERFPRAIDVLRNIVDAVPQAIVVISCLDDMYVEVRQFLTRSALDRLEREPAPVTLTARRSAEEIEEIIARRLQVLYESQEVRFRPESPLYPFRRGDLARITNLRTRDILNWCHAFRDRCIAAGRIIDPDDVEVELVPGPKAPTVNWAQQYNDFRSGFLGSIPDEDAALIGLLCRAATQVVHEAPEHAGLRVERIAENRLTVQIDDGPAYRTGICNRTPLGGSLGRQIEDIVQEADPGPAALVRTGPFPDNPRTKLARRLGEIVAAGGRKVVVQDTDWRTIMAFLAFQERHERAPGFEEWTRRDQPLSQLPGLRTLFGLGTSTVAEPERSPSPSATPEPMPMPTPEPAVAPAPESGPIQIGWWTNGDQEVVVAPDELDRNLAFLGGGAPMATALAVIEQALEQGRSVVIVDRNGDLCGLADPDRYPALPDDPNTPRAQRILRDVDVSLVTPGAAPGRSVWLPLVPVGLGDLPTQQRSMVAHFLAESLGSLMGYHGSEAEKSRLVLLAKAIEHGVALGETVDLTVLTDRIGDQDPAIVNAVGELNARQFEKLHDNLTALSWSHGELLEAAGAQLDASRLVGPHPRPRVSIVHVGQLRDATRMEYWVTRLLVELACFTAANETDDLHTLVLIDEADLWLPAEASPATKEPLMRLLRPGRRDGIGMVLWSERPGDLDYRPRENIGTWVLGPVDEGELSKMRTLLSDTRDAESQLLRKRTGHLHVLRGGELSEMRPVTPIVPPHRYSDEELLVLARQARG
ncbi:MAG: hypothetical protein AAGA48_15325 [Myxococcota bacterium]